ncbi:MAG: hypothetical protein ABSA93_41355 [Streptosporangiaceae bacterium]|jgi:hypothetical protein
MSESIASPPVSSEAASLWRNTNFRRLWAGQSVSLVGSAVSYIALPLVGIVLLRLDALQVGGIATAGTVPTALRSPSSAGSWIKYLDAGSARRATSAVRSWSDRFPWQWR